MGLLAKIKQALKPKENKKKKNVKTYTDNPLLKTKKKETSSTKKTAPKSLGGTLPTGKDRLDAVVKKKTTEKKTTTKTTINKTTDKKTLPKGPIKGTIPTGKDRIHETLKKKAEEKNPFKPEYSLGTAKNLFGGSPEKRAKNLGVDYQGKGSNTYNGNRSKIEEATKTKPNTKGDSPYQKYQANTVYNYYQEAKEAYDRGDIARGNLYVRKAQEHEEKYQTSKNAPKADPLTGNEALLLQTLSRSGSPEFTQKGLTSAQQEYANGDKTAEYGNIGGKLASNYKHDIDTAPFAQGVINGLSWVPVSRVVKNSSGVDDLNLEGDKTGFYTAGKMAGMAAQALGTGGVVKAASNLGRGARGLINAGVDSVQNIVDAVDTADSQREKGLEIPDYINVSNVAEAKNGATVKRGTEPGKKAEDAKLIPVSIDRWNNDLIAQAWNRAEELGQDPIFGTDKNGRLHYSFTKEGLASILEYYNTFKNPTYSLESTGREYVDSDVLRIGRNMAINTGLSFAGGMIGKGGKQTLKNTEKVAPKTAEEVAEGVAPKVDIEPKVKPKTEVKTKPKTKTPKVKTATKSSVTQKSTVKGGNKSTTLRKTTDTEDSDIFTQIAKEEESAKRSASRAEKASALADKDKAPTSTNSGDIKTVGKQYTNSANTYKQLHDELVDNLTDYIKNYKGKGAYINTNNVKGSEIGGKATQHFTTKISENEPWYRDFYKKNGRKPNKNEAKTIAEELVTDLERTGSARIDIDSTVKEALLKAKADMDGYADGLRMLHESTYPKYSDAEFQTLVRTGLEKEDWTDEMKSALQIDSKTASKTTGKIKLSGAKTKPKLPTKKTELSKAEETIDYAKTVNGKKFNNKVNNAEAGDTVATFKDGSRVEFTGMKQVDGEFEEAFTVIRNDGTKVENVGYDDLAKTLKTKKTLPNKSVGADKNRSIPKVKESKSKAAARLEAMGEGKTKYDAETHKGRNQAADTRLETDYEGEIKDLTNTERKMSSEDIATSEKLYQKLIKEGRKTEAKSLMRNVAKQSTEKGQELESLKHIKHNTVEGKIYEGYKTEHKARVAIEKTKRMKTANAEVKKAVDIINSAAKKSKDKDEFVENVTKAIDKILEERKIKDKVPLRDYIVETAAKVKSLDKSEMDTVIDQVTEEINKRLGIPTLSSEQINKITEYMKNADNAKTVQERKDWWARADEVIHSLETSTWHDKFRAMQRIAMLSNPKTLASRNAGGNLLLRTAETIKDVPATLADMATSKILKTDRTTTLLSAGKYKGQMAGFGQGIKGWGHDLKTGLDTSPTQTHYEYGSVKVFDPAKAKTKGMKVLYKSLDFLDGTIRKGLQLGDRPFYQSAYNGRVAELTTLVNKGKAKLTEKEIEESARMYALDQVFQGDTAIARRASELRRSMRIFGDILIPFTQTPANILDKLVDYSPVGFARDIYRLGVRRATGEFDQKQFVDTLGRAFTGSGVIMLGYALAKKGLLTTDIYQQSETAEEYKLRTLLGEQSYSLITNAEFDDKGNLTGGTYHSINWMSPVGSMLLMGADFYNGVEGSEEELLGALYRGFQTAVDGVFAQSFLSGVTDLIASNQYNSNTKSSGAAQKITDTLISQFTGQLSMNLLSSTTRVIDPYKRETYDPNKLKKAFNTWKSKNPLLSRTLPVKIGVDGKPIKQYQGRGKLSKMWESFLNPFNKSAHQSDAVNAEVLNVYNQTGSDSVLLNSMSNGKFTYNDTDFVIKSGDWLSRYQKTMGEYATTEIQKLMDKKSWQGLSYGEKAEKIAAINAKAEKIAIEDYLVSSGEMTQEQFDYTTLNKKQKGQVDSGIITATEIRKISDNVKAKGADKDTTQISELLQMGYSSKKIKQLGYDTKLTGKNGRGVTSYARAVKLADAGVNTKIYNKVTKVENVDTSGDGYASHEEVKTYIEKYYPKMSYEEKLAIMYARFGAKYY